MMGAVPRILLLPVLFGFLIILGPIVIIIVISFSDADFFAFPPEGFSLRWYREMFAMRSMMEAFSVSFQLATISACIATVIATAAALHISRHRTLSSSVVEILLLAPLVFPTIILGVALLLFYQQLKMPIFAGLVIAHTLVVLPYCFRSVLASLQGFDRTLEEAGESLGARPWRVFVLITLPLIWPGVLAGWLFSFIVSFGELNTALFLTGPGTVTLPIEIFSHLQFEGHRLVIAAASSVQIILIVVAIVVLDRVVGIARVARS